MADIASAGALTAHEVLDGRTGRTVRGNLEAADIAFREERWTDALGILADLVRRPLVGVDYRDILIKVGRCLIYLGDHLAAATILERLSRVYFDSFDVHFYLGRSQQLLYAYDEALRSLLHAALLKPNDFKCLVAIGTACHGWLVGGHGMTRPGPPVWRDVGINAYRRAIEAKRKDASAYLGLARLYAETGEPRTAITLLQEAADGGVDPRKLLGEAVRLAMRGGLYGEARRLLPGLEAARGDRLLINRAQRILWQLEPVVVPQDERRPGTIVSLLLAPAGPTSGLLRLLGKADIIADMNAPCATIEAELRRHDKATLVLVASPQGLLRGRQAAEAATAKLAPTIAGVVAGDPAAGGWALWPKPGLLALLDEFRRKGETFAALHARLLDRARMLRVPTGDQAPEPAKPRRARIRTVALISRNGPHKLGGGEHFLHEAGRYYRSQGCRTIFISFDSRASEERAETVGELEAFAVPDRPSALRRLLVRESVDLVHCLSGLGHTSLDAIGDLGIRLFYGIHFWREFLLSPACHDYYYPYVDRRSEIDPAFRAIVRRADHLYANSDLVATLCRRHLGMAPVRIPSIVEDAFGKGGDDPTDPDVQRAAALGEGFALLVNTRADKGFELMLEIAACLPDTRFLAIASQSSIGTARLRVAQCGLDNVIVLTRFDNMAPLFRRARVVLAPSFQFVETFSRVVVEAHRLGCPVIGAAAGNIPHLLQDSGFLLDEDPAAWATLIGQLMRDDAFHAAARERALRNSTRLSQRHQSDGFDLLFRSLRHRVLVAVGSGLGNVCHTLPFVRKVSEHLDVPVDILLDADSPGCAALFAGSPWVAAVYETHEHVVERPYDTVLFTHCFGGVVPELNARRVLASRDFVSFDPTEGRHEAVINLEFAERALGATIAPGDERRYFVGGHQYRQPGRGRVALHAGCKGGAYLVKRWPYFEDLARELLARGYEVVSVGGEDEHVEDTVRAGGGTVAEVIGELLACDLLVSNDSGIMNLGNALGMPVVALFGPSSARVRGPLLAPGASLQAPAPCSPCEESPTLKERFTKGQCGCIATLKLETVLAEVLRVLDGVHGTAPARAEATVGRELVVTAG